MKVVRFNKGSKVLARRRKDILKAHSAGVREGHQTMVRLCPVDKGDLLSTTTLEDDNAGHAAIGTGGASGISEMYVNHHVYIEWGTRKMAAQPYFRPGIDAAKQAVRRRFRAIS